MFFRLSLQIVLFHFRGAGMPSLAHLREYQSSRPNTFSPSPSTQYANQDDHFPMGSPKKSHQVLHSSIRQSQEHLAFFLPLQSSHLDAVHQLTGEKAFRNL